MSKRVIKTALWSMVFKLWRASQGEEFKKKKKAIGSMHWGFQYNKLEINEL